jgi:pimeloyl-ACP methyl ester carboxylesterase
MPWGFVSAASAEAARRANFGGAGTVAVDAHPFGISPYGAHAMAGNAKEWIASPVDGGRAVTGGSWQDPAYLFSEVGALDPTASSPALGFRCARDAAPGRGGREARPLRIAEPPPAYRPVDAATFRTLLGFYRYDRRPPNARLSRADEAPDWRRERWWIDGPAGDSVLLYLYLPKRARPPFQTLVNVPSSAAFFFLPVWQGVEQELGAHLRAGRAVLAPVFAGMLERPWTPPRPLPDPPSVEFRDLMVRHATELRMALDYLGTRAEIDTARLAYVGNSWGAGSRLPLAGVDDRFRAVVLVGAGIDERIHPTLPEAANFNFAPYIRAPKLMLNGRQDEEHPWATRALPLWNLLREPKQLVLVEGVGHYPPVEVRVPAINAFLDRTLGPVAPR